MHYYKRNLGDYAKKAGRLSMLQHGSYTLLIDACYDREQFPTRDEAIEWTWASSTTEIEAVDFVLRKFFVLESGVYVQKRIEEEISEYRGKAKTNKRIAVEREANRKEAGTIRAQVVNEPTPNHKPRTINQEPETKTHTSPSCETVGGKTSACVFPDQPTFDDSGDVLPTIPVDQTAGGEPGSSLQIMPSMSTAVCMAMKATGMAAVNPSNPEIAVLLQSGADVEMFVVAAKMALDSGKGFAYAIGIVKSQMTGAKALADQIEKNPKPPPKNTGKYAAAAAAIFDEQQGEVIDV